MKEYSDSELDKIREENAGRRKKRRVAKKKKKAQRGRPKGNWYSGIQKRMTMGEYEIVHTCNNCDSKVIERGAAYVRHICAACGLQMSAKVSKISEETRGV